jgi:hypothetical protein
MASLPSCAVESSIRPGGCNTLPGRVNLLRGVEFRMEIDERGVKGTGSAAGKERAFLRTTAKQQLFGTRRSSL